MTSVPREDGAVEMRAAVADTGLHAAKDTSVAGPPLSNELDKPSSSVPARQPVVPIARVGFTTAPPKELDSGRSSSAASAEPLPSAGSALREAASPSLAAPKSRAATPHQVTPGASPIGKFFPSGLSDFASKLLRDEALPTARPLPKTQATTTSSPPVERARSLRVARSTSPALKPAALTRGGPSSPAGFTPSGFSDFSSQLLTDEALDEMLTTPAPSTTASTSLASTTTAPTCVCLEREGRNVCHCHDRKKRRYGSR